MTLLVACGGGGTSSPTPLIKLNSISVTPSSASFAKGLDQQLTATGSFSDGTSRDLTTQASWSSSSASVASVSKGKVSGLTAGSSTISATVNDPNAGVVTGTTSVSVTSATVTSIAVTPASASVPKGNKQQFTATGTFTDGSTLDISANVTWAVSGSATISNTGLATGSAIGSASVNAKAGNVTSSNAALTVTAPALVTINVSPASVVVPKGLTQNFTASGVYTDGSTQDLTSSVTWASTSGASITSGGVATAQTLGLNTVTATQGVISGSADLTVANGKLMSLTVSPATASIAKGLTQSFTVLGTFSDATTQDLTNAVVWSATTGASISNTGVATGTATGSVTVTASSGTVTSNGAALTVLPAALVTLTVTPVSASIARSTNQQFTATGIYTDASSVDISSSVTWTATSGASISNSGLAHATAVGSTNVYATSGSITSNIAALTVTYPAMSSIVIGPGSVSLGLGGHQQYSATGTFVDAVTTDVTSLVNWNSGSPSVVSFGANGLANVVSTSSSAVSITANFGSTTSNTVFLSALSSLPRVCDSPTIDMKLLVVTDGKSEADYGAITQVLDYVGTPYDVLDMTVTTGGVTSAMLSDGECHGYYQGVIMANGGYIYTLPGMSTLTSYETTFKVRQINWFTYPGPDFGLNATGSSSGPGTPVTANFTPEAASVFTQVSTNNPITITNASVYPATATSSATPLLTDNSGHVLSAINDFGDGRLYLTQTFDSNQYLTHNLVLAYGLLNWVTKGVFLGEYHVYLTPQIDDVFIADAMWEGTTPCIDPASPSGDHTDADAETLNTVRMDKNDVDALVAWQNLQQQNPMFGNFVIHMAFNGAGTTGRTSTGGYRNDTLTPEFKLYQDKFKWLSHTWDHPDSLNGQTASFIDDQITKNNDQAILLGLTTNDPAGMVTPGITGLNDSTFVNRAVANGVKYVVTDTSVLNTPNNGPNPSPNVGIVNSINSGLYMVPRHANNLFFNVADPDGWVAEYQCIYTGQPPYSSYTYQQIKDNITDSFIVNMLKGDMDPQMFHQPNLVAYDGTHSLLTDLLDETFTTYSSIYKLPVLSPTLKELAEGMQARNVYNQSGVTASLVNAGTASASVSITIPSSSPVTAATIPVTGLNSTGAEVYGGQNISHIQVNVGQTQTLPLQ
jgi:hypothetical protein